MAAPNQPLVPPLPEGYQVGTTVVTPQPAERAYPLRNPDFLTLCDGSNGDERAGKDLCLGLLISAVIGIVGIVASIDWGTVFAQKEWWMLLCPLALVAIAAGSGVGFAVHRNRMEKEDTPYTRLKESISDFFQQQV